MEEPHGSDDAGRWPTPEQVVASLDTAGHLLEQQVATRLEALGYHAATNRAYTGPDEGKSRELDVYAFRQFHHDQSRRLHVGMYLLVECKNTAAPLALLTRPVHDLTNTVPQELVMTRHTIEEPFTRDGKNMTAMKPMFDELGLREKYWGTAPVRAVHLSRLERKGSKWVANNTSVFDSLTWPMAKATRAFRKPLLNENRGFKAATDRSHVMLLVPMVVVASKLFVADGTASTPTAREVSHVRFEREFMAKAFKGVFGLDFVQRDALESFVTDTVGGFVKDLVTIAQSDPDSLIPPDGWPMASRW